MSLYQKIIEDVRRDVDTGKIKAGQRLPSFADLMKRYRVSKITAQSAIKELTACGVAEFETGVGYRLRGAREIKTLTLATYACYRPIAVHPTYAAFHQALKQACEKKGWVLNIRYDDSPDFYEATLGVVVGIFDLKDLAPFEGKKVIAIDRENPFISSISFDLTHAVHRVVEAAGPGPLLLVTKEDGHTSQGFLEKIFLEATGARGRSHRFHHWYDEGEAETFLQKVWKGETVLAFNNLQAELLVRTAEKLRLQNLACLAVKKGTPEHEPGGVPGVRVSHEETAAMALDLLESLPKSLFSLNVRGSFEPGGFYAPNKR